MLYLTQRRSSSLVRASLLIYFLLILYASLYPFSGWRDPGVIPVAYLFLPLPRYWTWFDLITNIIGYIPFGILVALVWPPSVSHFRAFIFAVAAGVLLSMTMEATQSFLPSRVSSNLDFFTNAFGAVTGAFIGIGYRSFFADDVRVDHLCHKWFGHNGISRLLIVPLLWPLAQIYPQAYLFGHGYILPVLSNWLSYLTGSSVDLNTLIKGNVILTAKNYLLAEMIITASGLVGAMLILLFLLSKEAPKIGLAFSLVLAALLIKTLACALLFMPGNAFVWLTPGAVVGLLTGGLMLFGLIFAPRPIQRGTAGVMLVVCLLAVNLIPDNQYFLSTLQTWTQGKFLHFNGAAYFLALIWPLLALWFLFRPIYSTPVSE